jgi:multisubunit Na+/H+ antiporter MnhB subunit
MGTVNTTYAYGPQGASLRDLGLTALSTFVGGVLVFLTYKVLQGERKTELALRPLSNWMLVLAGLLVARVGDALIW